MNYFQCSNQKKNYRLILFFLLVAFFYCYPIIASEIDSKIDSTLKKANNFRNVNSDSAQYYAIAALNLSRESHNPRMEYKSLIYLTRFNIKAGHLGEAIFNCAEATRIVESNNFLNSKVEVLMYSGVAYQAMGLSSDALNLFLEAQNQKSDTINYNVRIDLDFYTGSVYADINEFKKCNAYLHSSISQSIENDYILGALKSYLLLSNTYNNVDSIRKYLDLANSIIEENPSLTYEKVVLRNTQALVNKAIGNLKLSKTQYLEAISISKRTGYQESLSNLYNNYAYLLMEESKYDSAKNYLDHSLEIAISIKSLDMELEIYDSYSDYFENIGDFESALKYADLFIEKRDQYRDQQRIQQSLFLSAVFETEQKEKEILQQDTEIARLWMIMFGVLAFLAAAIGGGAYLRQKLSLSRSRLETVEKGKALEIADALIHGQDAERKRLAMDLHDGLGARLGALRFLVDGFFKSHEKFEEISDSIVNIHQNVRDLSHRMLPTNLESLGLLMSIKNMASSINKSDKFVVEFETNFDKRLTNKLETNLYYLIYELINNATRHSNGNTIFIQLLEHDDYLSLSVEDNGSGFDQKDNTSGMGLKNIKTRVEYLGGQLSLESTDFTTLFMIEIPNKKL